MTPQEIAEVRPELLDFAAEMLGGLPRKDQRAAGELYVRGLLTDGQRKSMQPMAARLGVDHQRLQQFITSSTWDYAAVRRNVARDFAGRYPVEALVVDDTGFGKDGSASPCVARQYSGTLGKIGNCQAGVSVHRVNEHASCAADWRLFCPQSWDDAALADPVAAARAARRRERAGIPDQVRHTEKWRLALEIIEERTETGSLIISQYCAGDRVTSSTSTFHSATSRSPAVSYRALTYPGAAHRNISGPSGPGGASTASAATACMAIVVHGFSPGLTHTDEHRRPPGLSTRANSAVALATSGKNMYPNRTEILPNAASPNGRSSALHTLVSKLVIPCASARRVAMPSISAARSVRTTCPLGASLATVSPGSPVPAAMSRCC